MLTVEELRSIAGGLVRVSMDDRQDQFEGHIRTTVEQAAARGLLGSSILHHQILAAYAAEVRARALEIWAILHRVVGTAGIPDYPDSAIPLKGFVIEFLSPEDARLRHALDADLDVYGLPNEPRDRFQVAIDRSIQVVRSEIELYLKSLDRPAEASTTINQVYNAPVGAVQTGSHATAHVTQLLNQTDVENLRAVLVSIRDEIEQVESEEVPQREEVLEMIRAADVEMSKEQPRRFTLGGLLGGISAGIQTLPNVAPAYHVLRTAAAQAGIPLP